MYLRARSPSSYGEAPQSRRLKPATTDFRLPLVSSHASYQKATTGSCRRSTARKPKPGLPVLLALVPGKFVSQVNRKKAKTIRKSKECYTPQTLAKGVLCAGRNVGVDPWHPNQLRHTHGTEVRRIFGLEAAQLALGHSQANVTQIYAERDGVPAQKITKELG